MARDPYPLQWPEGWPRTESWKRGKPQFGAQFARDRDSVFRQLKRGRRASNIVITSDLPTRNDGMPYANASCSDPGIAVWWIEKGRERVLACDRWRHINYNLRAIDLTLEALRGLDRWGASEVVERAFAGFAALPPGADAPRGPRPWRDVIGGSWPEGIDRDELFVIAKSRYRKAIEAAHPDRGGDPAVAAELNVAIAAAEAELTSPTAS